MRVPEWLRTYAALEKAGGLEFVPKQLCDLARRYKVMEEALELAEKHHQGGHSEVGKAIHAALAAARAPISEMI